LDIAFLTLFLGLIHGPTAVEISAGPEIVAVEVLLDGKSVARLAEPPWATEVNLGADLLPHHLVARGLDAHYEEVGRAEQWMNLPRPPAEVQIVFEKAAAAKARVARVAWQSVTNDSPTAISLTLDGVALKLDAENRATVPARPAAGLTRVLSATLRFANGVVARQDVALGSEYGDEVATELTALPVRLRRGSHLPPVAQLQGWFTADGKALRVSAVDGGPARLLVVREPGAASRVVGWSAIPQHQYTLKRGSRLRYLGTTAQSFADSGSPASPSTASTPPAASSVTFELFQGSQELDAGEYGLTWLLSRVVQGDSGSQARTADAVAVGGLQAAGGSGPRAVLLLLGGGIQRDASRYDGPTVRRYLAALHVPLFVWSARPPSESMKTTWGAVEDVSTPPGLDRAFQRLAEELDAQRIVQLEGRHLPQSIALSQRAQSIIPPP
jgi:hypothetical protein